MTCGNEDETLYQGTAYYYHQYRPRYSKEFYDAVFDKLGIGKNAKVMDLGCATGIVALDIAPRVREVLAIDIEPEFLAEGVKLARSAGLENIRWIRNRAENLYNLHQKTDFTFISQAFHWMDRAQVLEELYDLTSPGGGVVIGSFLTEEKWSAPLQEIIRKYTGTNDYETRKKLGLTQKHTDIIEQSKFEDCEILEFSYPKTTTADEILGYFYSTPYCSLKMLGSRKDAFEEEMRAYMDGMTPEMFDETLTQRALIARKKDGQ